ncbi:hypothetical protein [Vreelandella sp.]|uniref:hypothetical protein n=1 Tax=Vreelandella sp. TaxID=3137778 RepID=UPI003BA8E63D
MTETIVVQVLTGFFAVVAAFGSVYLSNQFEKKRKERVIRNALVQEVQTILYFLSNHDYLNKLAELQEGNFLVIEERVPVHYFSVYEALLSDIGFLRRTEVSDLIYFYTVAKDVGRDMILHTSSVPLSDAKTKVYYMMKHNELLNAIAFGNKFVKES